MGMVKNQSQYGRRELSEYGNNLDVLLAMVVSRCETLRETIPERALSRADLERIRNSANRIFTEFYAGVSHLNNRFSEDIVS